MVFFNYALRKLNAKIVYYGPGLCGKTTNLVWIHDHFDGGERGKMISLATEGDRTIFFDLLPIEIGSIRGMDVTLQLYTVPGQVHYNSTRQLVLRGADGVVFVADSQRAMQSSNIDSFKNLQENLLLQGISLDGFPHALQFNKRDLRDTVSMEELNDDLNRYSVPIFEAIATEGVGVQETLEGIVKLVMRNLRERYEGVAAGAKKPGFEDPSRARATVQKPAAPVEVPPPQPPVTPPPEPQAAVTPPAPEEPFPQEPFPQEPFPQEPVSQRQAPETPPPQEPVVPPEPAPPPPPAVRVFSPEEGATTVDFSKTQGPGFIEGFGAEGVDEEAPTAMYKVGDELAESGSGASAPAEPPAGVPPAAAGDAAVAQATPEQSGVLEIGADLFTSMESSPEPSAPAAEPPAPVVQQPPPAVEPEVFEPPDLDSYPDFELDTGEPEPEPEPLPEPEPVSEPPPEPTPEPVPEYVPEPIPEAAPPPSAAPIPEAGPEPIVEPTPQPVPEPVPEFAPEAAPEPVFERPVESFADIDTEGPEIEFITDDTGGEPPRAVADRSPSEGRYEDWISAPSPFAPKPHEAGQPRDVAQAFAAAEKEVETATEDAAPAAAEPADQAPAVPETVASEVPPQAPAEPETVAFEVPPRETPDFIEMPEPETFSEELETGGEGSPFDEFPVEEPAGEGFPAAEDVSFDSATVEEVEPAIDFSVDPVMMEEIEPPRDFSADPVTMVDMEALEEISVEPAAMEEPEPLEDISVEPEVFGEGVSYADFEEPEAEPPAAIEPAARRDVAVSAEDNQLHLRLQGTGAIIESGQVRELDIEVPVPGAWVGNRRVTLQLRLTLTPNSEDEDGGHSPS